MIPSKKSVEALVRAAYKLVHQRAPKCCGKKMRDGGRSGCSYLRDSKGRAANRKKFLGTFGKRKQPDLPATRPVLEYLCSKCKTRFERAMLFDEQKLFHKHDLATDLRSRGMHKTWHAFLSKFSGGIGKWRWSGWDFMVRVERYAKTHPGITVLRCDDNHHSGSDIVAIAHELADLYWGTTFVLIPQHGGPPADFFFYDSHAQGFSGFLHGVLRKHKTKGRD